MAIVTSARTANLTQLIVYSFSYKIHSYTVSKYINAWSTQIHTTDEFYNVLIIFRLHHHILFLLCVILTYTELGPFKPEIYLNKKKGPMTQRKQFLSIILVG
jgi:hypothetical protein